MNFVDYCYSLGFVDYADVILGGLFGWFIAGPAIIWIAGGITYIIIKILN